MVRHGLQSSEDDVETCTGIPTKSRVTMVGELVKNENNPTTSTPTSNRMSWSSEIDAPYLGLHVTR